MQQLWIFVLQGLFIGICDEIDIAFGNNISIDAICVLSAYTVITWITYCTYQMGGYAYRIMLSKEKNCLAITLIISILLGIIIFTFSNKIPHLYKLTNNQYEVFTKCLKVHAISIPVLAIGEFLGNYIVLKCMNKLMWISNIVLYAIMILLDLAVFINGYGLEYLILTTFISYVVYDMLLITQSKILRVQDKITLSDLRLCIKHALNMYTDRILGKVATITYNIYASRLGTEIYAIHCICYSISTFTENITNAQFNYQLIRLVPYEGYKEKYKICIDILKKTLLPLSIIGYVTSFILLIFLHGDIVISNCILPLVVYCSQVILIQLYESLRGYLTSLKKSELLKWAGLIGIFIRIPITLIAYYCNIGIYGFAIASSLDFLCRGIYFYMCHRIKISRANNKRI